MMEKDDFSRRTIEKNKKSYGASKSDFGSREDKMTSSQFKQGRINLSNKFYDGRSSTVVNNENIDTVRRMIETDQYVTYREIRASLGIGMSQLQLILYKYLDMKKLCSRWIPHNLTAVQKNGPRHVVQVMLIRFEEGALNSVWDIVTGEATWMYCYDLKSNNRPYRSVEELKST
ncbi:hypothetical protein EVAR_54616_1 [Eumeta japonica]|uniref:Histone-lysine N-methyltransferase SETMAR n=1 Tax=Eumeta variegata TaxID=151549 RepID=A0A4C1YLK8_EUMVA|nr:hypothetical protein EVAR_54616_1 [Eumeta japonica]